MIIVIIIVEVVGSCQATDIQRSKLESVLSEQRVANIGVIVLHGVQAIIGVILCRRRRAGVGNGCNFIDAAEGFVVMFLSNISQSGGEGC